MSWIQSPTTYRINEDVFPTLESVANRTRDNIWIDSLDEARTADRQNDSIVQPLQMTKNEWPSCLHILATSKEDIHVKDGENRIDISRFLPGAVPDARECKERSQ